MTPAFTTPARPRRNPSGWYTGPDGSRLGSTPAFGGQRDGGRHLRALEALGNEAPRQSHSVSTAGTGQEGALLHRKERHNSRPVCKFRFPQPRGPAETPRKRWLCAPQLVNSPEKSVWPSSATRTTRGTADSSSKTEHTAILAGCFPLTPEKIFLTCLGHPNDTRRG